ncbi:hypothetical protein BDY19DRAFT_956379 [Irpex rosettiformis]|uniref:Uncharacterized protein n=1 Tax=Irpex rosettiformis TaxID=378272 RepID=A0ACB8TYK3_9APHY|nr:hypothetical protein BDY19DRAFT_956379 [Irpex rosettiformis]
MLSPLRRPLPHCFLQNISRSYATEATSASTSTSQHIPLPADSPTRKTRPYLAAQRNQYLYVRCRDDTVSTMPEFLGIIRGLERELGRMKDFQFHSDPYETTRLQRWFRIRLEDPAYWDTVPDAGTSLQVSIPVPTAASLKRPGGISIGDIQTLLEPQDKVGADFVPLVEEDVQGKDEKKKNTEVKSVEVIIQRSVSKDPEQATYVISKERRAQIGKSIIGWGGFYSSAPVSAESSSEGVDGSESAPLELTRMQKLKQRYGGQSQSPAAEEIKGEVEGEEALEILTENQTPEQELVDDVVMEVEIDAVTEPAPPELASLPKDEEASAPAPEISPSPPQTASPTPSDSSSRSSTLSKRAQRKEKLLDLARMNAQEPLPEALKQRELEAQKQLEEEAAEKERQEKERNPRAIRERLWKLMGGLLP